MMVPSGMTTAKNNWRSGPLTVSEKQTNCKQTFRTINRLIEFQNGVRVTGTL
jgi:hypothetical protein